MTPTSPGSHFKPLIFNYINPYMVYFKHTRKILRKNLKFARNSESKREFFTKHPQVNFLLICAFSGLDLWVLRLLITSLFDCKYIWLRGIVKIKPKSFYFWGISSKLSFSFLCFFFLLLIFLFYLFFLFIYVLICLLSLGFLCFIV